MLVFSIVHISNQLSVIKCLMKYHLNILVVYVLVCEHGTMLSNDMLLLGLKMLHGKIAYEVRQDYYCGLINERCDEVVMR